MSETDRMPDALRVAFNEFSDMLQRVDAPDWVREPFAQLGDERMRSPVDLAIEFQRATRAIEDKLRRRSWEGEEVHRQPQAGVLGFEIEELAEPEPEES